MHDLVQVVGGGRRVELRPERVHQLLAMQPMARGEGEELDQLAPLAQAPRRRGDRLAVARGGEPAEQLDRDVPRGLRVILRLGLQASTPDLSAPTTQRRHEPTDQPYCVACSKQTQSPREGRHATVRRSIHELTRGDRKMASLLNEILARQRAEDALRSSREGRRDAGAPGSDRPTATTRLAAVLGRSRRALLPRHVEPQRRHRESPRRQRRVAGKALVLADGRSARIGPMRPEDRAMYRDAVAGLSDRSRYLRFAAPVPRRISDRLLNTMMALDGDCHRVYAALTPDEGAVIGVARFVRPDGRTRSAEVAIAIADEWQCAGLGSALLTALIERARTTDLERLTAITLSENRGAAQLARAVGFAPVRREGLHAEFELELDALDAHAPADAPALPRRTGRQSGSDGTRTRDLCRDRAAL